MLQIIDRLIPVTEKDEIIANVLLLRDYLLRPANSEELNWAIKLIRKGRNFVVYRTGSAYNFGPSKFAGYAGNTLARYERWRLNRRGAPGKTDGRFHGGRTDEYIDAILGFKEVNQELERQYLTFCDRNGFSPLSYERAYWLMDNSSAKPNR